MRKQTYSKRFERNLAACWGRADEWHRDQGLLWYQRANATACDYANKFDATVEQACGVIAALSPGRNWDMNLLDAETFMVEWKHGARGRNLPRVGSYGQRNLTKAARIMAGKPPLDVLGGLKVRAFYACMINPANAEDVCIDRHAKSAAYGKRLGDRGSIVRKSEYGQLAEQYRRLAGKVGVLPHQAQAVCWVVWRSLKGNLDQTGFDFGETV